MSSHLTHYTLRHRAIAIVSHWFDGFEYTVRHGLLIGMKRKGGLGFLPTFLIGKQETAETQFLRSLDYTNGVVYDVGGYQGLLTLFFAAKAKQVIVYEPNPASFRRLEENLRLNGVANVHLRTVGLGATRSTATLTFDPLMTGGASADPAVGGQIRESSVYTEVGSIVILPLDEDRQRFTLPAPTFIKIDVEGMEVEVLRGMRETLRAHPAVYIELHGAARADKLSNALGVYRLLTEAGYTRLWSVEQGYAVTPDTIAAEIPSHLYCTRT
jgi:FkbM family methyltransferase